MTAQKSFIKIETILKVVSENICRELLLPSTYYLILYDFNTLLETLFIIRVLRVR